MTSPNPFASNVYWEDLIARRLGYGFFSSDRHRILQRTLKLIQYSQVAPAALQHDIARLTPVNLTGAIPILERHLLSRPKSPYGHWTMFRGLFDAEHEFCRSTLKAWDDERTMMGELVNGMIQSVKTWGTKVTTALNVDPGFHFCRTNTVFNRGEQISGADFGLIIQDGSSGFKSLAIQAKKVSGRFADVSQMAGSTGETQLAKLTRAPRLGHYLFFMKRGINGAAPPPLMCPATIVQDRKRPNDTFDVLSNTCDMAAYLTFGMATPGIDAGVPTQSANDAVRVMFEGYPDLAHATDRIVVVRLGHSETLDWNAVIQHEAERALANTPPLPDETSEEEDHGTHIKSTWKP